MTLPTQTTPRSQTLPPRPRLVLRVGFAGRKELSTAERSRLVSALHEVLSTVGHELAALTPGVPVRADEKPRIASFFAPECPLLRLVTGLCEGADAAAAEALETVRISPDAGVTLPAGHALPGNRDSLPYFLSMWRAIEAAVRRGSRRSLTANSPTVRGS